MALDVGVAGSWAALQRKFNRTATPLFYAPPITFNENGDIVVHVPTRTRAQYILIGLVACGIVGVIGVVCFISGRSGGGSDPVAFYLGMPVAAILFATFFCACILRPLVYIREMRFPLHRATVIVSYGTRLYAKRVELPVELCEAELKYTSESDLKILEKSLRGMPCLRLRLKEKDGDVVLAVGDRQNDLTGAFQALESHFAGGGKDESVRVVTLADGRQINVSMGSLNQPGYDLDLFTKACATSPDKATPTPSVSITVFRACYGILLIVMGTAFSSIVAVQLVKSIASGRYGSEIVKDVILISVAVPFAVVGVLILMGKLWRPRAAMIDRLRGLILKDGKTVVTIPPDQVAAVQLCFNPSYHERKNSSPNWEINVVLAEPPGKRLCLLTAGFEESAKADARRIAGLLGKPLLG